MNTKLFAVSYKSIMAIAVLVAVVVQFLNGMNRGASTVNFFSFFTIESNIFGAVVMLVSAYSWARGFNSPKLDMFRGAATLYMVVTGIVYSALLYGLEVSLQTTIPWVNFVLHTLFPIIILVDWFIDRPSTAISFKKSLIWLIFPLVYVVYSLIRGNIVGWYPYPFLNPANGGYETVMLVSAGIAVSSLAIGYALSRSRPVGRLA